MESRHQTTNGTDDMSTATAIIGGAIAFGAFVLWLVPAACHALQELEDEAQKWRIGHD